MPKDKTKDNFPTARPFLPEQPDLANLREASETCRGCDLFEKATQTVFGEGAESALMLVIGEQPGDQEDQIGRPFVGPAGKILDRALAEAGISRKQVYVTNAVKHFKWVARGKRRLHDKPRRSEIMACRPWLEAEISTVQPRIVVCLGATAAQSLMGTSFKVTRERGKVLKTEWAPLFLATIHPSALLRIIDETERHQAFAEFVADLKKAADAVTSSSPVPHRQD
ncbi:MAG: uracil-DNA glycosylase [Acidobacteria bacterium]|nr:MAG: uracil-DNA glycosylase [Acidobacteriota bacterium]